MTHKIGKRFYSIKFRLMALITLILLLVVGLPLSLFVYQLDKNYEEFSVNMIETASQVVYQFIYDGMIKNDSILIQKNIDLLALDPSIALVRLYRPGGKILYSSEHDEIKKSIKDLPDNVAFFKSNSGEFEIFHRHENVYAHNHAIRVQEECLTCHQDIGKTIAILDVHAGITSSEQLYTTLKKLAIFGGALIIILLWFILGFLYQTQIENKLHAIVLGFDRLSKRDFNFKITIPGKHELAMLADKFNQMVDNLNRARNKEEKFLIEKMARADRLVTLGEVAAEIAHEVNNPASIILTRAEYLKEEMQEKNLDSACIVDLSIIIEQTKKIAETTRSILHYSKKMPHTFSEVNINEVIKHSLKIIQPRIKKQKVKIDLNLPDESASVWGNFNQLDQVFCNLINNSLDFLKNKGGQISISNKKNVTNGNIQYLITYTDNGPGIPLEFREKIFTPFFTTKEGDKGTGLGLFIIKNILSNHKGTINLDDKHRKGTKFFITIGSYHGKD